MTESTINGATVDYVITDDVYDYAEATDIAAEEQLALNAGFYEAAPSKPIVIPTYKTFRSALANTSAIQTISRRG